MTITNKGIAYRPGPNEWAILEMYKQQTGLPFARVIALALREKAEREGWQQDYLGRNGSGPHSSGEVKIGPPVTTVGEIAADEVEMATWWESLSSERQQEERAHIERGLDDIAMGRTFPADELRGRLDARLTALREKART